MILALVGGVLFFDVQKRSKWSRLMSRPGHLGMSRGLVPTLTGTLGVVQKGKDKGHDPNQWTCPCSKAKCQDMSWTLFSPPHTDVKKGQPSLDFRWST